MGRASTKPTAVDLFSGAGGATQGLEDAGFQVIAAIECDADAVATYAANHPRVRVESGDIRKRDPGLLRKALGLAPGELGLLKACPPCQGFSTLGKFDRNDPRNDLVSEVWRFIAEFRPKAFLVENVPGLRNDARLQGMIRNAGRAGYGVGQYLLDAQQLGVPQRRKRLIVAGVLGMARTSLPCSILDVIPASFDRSARSAGDALRLLSTVDLDEDELHRWRQARPATLSRIRAVPRGGTRFDLPRRYWLPCHVRVKRHCAGASYGRIKVSAPAPTMTTRCTTPACGAFIHPRANRGISLREAALFQTFPITYSFVGGYDSVERQIGNAVPVRMAHGLGLAMRNLLAQAGRR